MIVRPPELCEQGARAVRMMLRAAPADGNAVPLLSLVGGVAGMHARACRQPFPETTTPWLRSITSR
jgi:hypothetical protein